MLGGDNGVVLVPDPRKSKLIIAIRYHDEEIRMQGAAGGCRCASSSGEDGLRSADGGCGGEGGAPYDYAKATILGVSAGEGSAAAGGAGRKNIR
jgi:hypothetical protein